jgi:antiviral helicase SKI2
VACEINTCEELLLTELIFENLLAALEPEEIASVLSCLIFQEKTQDEPQLTARLDATKDSMTKIAMGLAGVQLQAGLELDPREYARSVCNFGLMEVVYEWARGMSFKDICELTTVPEGSIVRCITRLDETCREVRNSARVIGDPALYKKMEATSECIKRDIVFATSLYIQ